MWDKGQRKINGTSQDDLLCYGKQLPYADKEVKEDETGGKIALIHQETKSEEAARKTKIDAARMIKIRA